MNQWITIMVDKYWGPNKPCTPRGRPKTSFFRQITPDNMVCSRDYFLFVIVLSLLCGGIKTTIRLPKLFVNILSVSLEKIHVTLFIFIMLSGSTVALPIGLVWRVTWTSVSSAAETNDNRWRDQILKTQTRCDRDNLSQSTQAVDVFQMC